MQHDHSATPPASLDSVIQQFQRWRETRSKMERIPASLWALVTPLLGQYSRSEIASALKISYGQLKQYGSPLPSLPQQTASTVSFVECALPKPMLPPTSTEVCQVEFTCKSGSSVKVSGVSSTQMQLLISLLIDH